MTRYHFSMRGAYEAGAVEHPQIEIVKFFPDATGWEASTIGDCWFFVSARAPTADLPEYFTPFGADGRPDWHWRDAAAAKAAP